MAEPFFTEGSTIELVNFSIQVDENGQVTHSMEINVRHDVCIV